MHLSRRDEERLARAVGPILDAKRREDRAIALKLKDALVKLLRESLGPKHPGRRVALLAAAGVPAERRSASTASSASAGTAARSPPEV